MIEVENPLKLNEQRSWDSLKKKWYIHWLGLTTIVRILFSRNRMVYVRIMEFIIDWVFIILQVSNNEIVDQ